MSESPVPAKQSASVVIVRDGEQSLEVLLLRRNQKIVFHGGDWVFPGGRVDDSDRHCATDTEVVIASRAASREASEEAGLDVAAEQMRPFSHWTTPVGLPKRFATWFFVANVDGNATVQVDNSEIVDYRWLSPSRALELRAAGELGIPAPTFVTLLGFKDIADCAAMTAHVTDLKVQRYVPKMVNFEGGRCTLFEEDVGYEAADLSAQGARHRLTMRGTDYDYVRIL